MRIHVGPVFAPARKQKTIFDELFLEYVFAQLPPPSNILWKKWLYSHTHTHATCVCFGANTCGARIGTWTQIHMKNIPGELSMYWFRAGG